MENNQDIFATIDNNREKHISFLQQLVRAAKTGEKAIQILLAERFKELGCEVDVLKLLPTSLSLEQEFAAEEKIDMKERISVVGKFQGEGCGRSLMFFAHPDSELVTSTDDWTHDPFTAEIEEGRIYGWGVADDLVGVAIMTEALDAVLSVKHQLKGDVYLCSTASKRNARGVIALLSKGYHANAAIYLHPAESGEGLNEIKAVASGLLNFRIVVTGQAPDTTEPSHTPFAHLGVNSLDKALLIIENLKNLDKRRKQRVYHSLLDSAIGQSTNLLISSISCGNTKELNRVPEECIIHVSITFPPNEELPQVQKEVEDCISEIILTDPWLKEHPPSITWLFGTQGAEVPVEHPIYQTVSNALHVVTAEVPHVNPLHSASDIRNPMLFSGIPTVGFGPLAGNLTQTGGHDEWVDLKDYIHAIKACAKILVEWCGVA